MSTYQDEKKYSSLARALKDADYAMIDTCSLMEDSFPEFLDILEETKKEYLETSFPVYVLESSIEELKKHAGNKEQKDKKIAATQAMRILTKAKKKKTVEIIKAASSGRSESRFGKDKEEDAYYFADAEIIAKVTLDRTKYNIVVITQDKKLASDLINLSNSQAVFGSRVHVYKIEANAMLAENKGEERIISSKKAGSSVLLKEKTKPAKEKPQPQPEAKGPTPRQTHRPDPNELLNKVIANDKRIHANLSNTNYSKDKMLKDLKTQLADFQKIPVEKLAAAHLSHNAESLAYEIKKIENPEQLKLPVLVAPKPVEQPKKTTKKEAKDALWYEYGQTVEEAFRNVGQHYGIIFRDIGVPYVPGVHGPVNFTTDDLAKIVATYGNTLKEGQKIIKQYRSVYLMAEKTQKGIKAWIDLNGLLAPKQEEKQADAPTPKEKPKQKPVKQAKPAPAKEEKVVTIVEDEVPEAPREEPAPKPTKKKQAPKSKKPQNPSKLEEKPAESSQNPENEPAKPVQKEPAKKVQKKASPAQTPATEKEEAKPKKKTHLEEAVEYDEKLKANINNPNYPKETKIKDVNDQIARVKKIPLKDREALHFDLNSLKAFLALLG